LDDRFEILPRRARQKSLAFRGTGKRWKLTCVDSASFVRSKSLTIDAIAHRDETDHRIASSNSAGEHSFIAIRFATGDILHQSLCINGRSGGYSKSI